MKLENKVAVVTGASSGMGKAIVERFVKEGASVVAVARRKERLDALAASLADAPGKIAVFPGDISKKESAEGMIDFAVKTFGTLDILVNNAGVMDDMGGTADLTDEKFDHVITTNVYGPMYAMRKAVNFFKENKKSGNIINITSIGAFHTAGGAVYGASKGALNAMTKNTAYKYKEDHIRCNAVAPGGIDTEIASSMGMPNMAGAKRIQLVLASRPETGSADNIASAVLFLAGEDSADITGAVIPVDGGWDSM